MSDALAGEMKRRQELLRAAGRFANISEYHHAQSRGAALPPLPALFILVDEFSELLSQHPDFAELFVAIGRLGRSLGMHLLLASQRLDEGRLRGLETHLSYRICLKPSQPANLGRFWVSPMPITCRAHPERPTSSRRRVIWCVSRRPSCPAATAHGAVRGCARRQRR